MQYRQNLHTHNHYCDGQGTLEEFVQQALEFGMDTLGFSCIARLKDHRGPGMDTVYYAREPK